MQGTLCPEVAHLAPEPEAREEAGATTSCMGVMALEEGPVAATAADPLSGWPGAEDGLGWGSTPEGEVLLDTQQRQRVHNRWL